MIASQTGRATSLSSNIISRSESAPVISVSEMISSLSIIRTFILSTNVGDEEEIDLLGVVRGTVSDAGSPGAGVAGDAAAP